jgi:hypothetical protein
MAEPPVRSSLKWQSDHLELEYDDSGKCWLVSTASLELVRVEALEAPGKWALSFADELGVLSYESADAEDSDAEPLDCIYAQERLTWKAYRTAGGAVELVGTSGQQFSAARFASLHDIFEVGWALRGVCLPLQFRCFFFTYAFPGKRVFVSLRSLSEHLKWKRLAKSRECQISAVIWDRWSTWTRLLDRLRFTEALRRSMPYSGRDNAPDAAERSTTQPCVTVAGFLVILIREAFGLCIREGPTETLPACQLHLSGLILRFARPATMHLFLDRQASISATGVVSGAIPFTVTMTSTGMLHIIDFLPIIRSNRVALDRLGFDVELLLTIPEHTTLLDLFQGFGQGMLTITKETLLFQLVHAFALQIETALRDEQAALVVGRSPKTEEVHHVVDTHDTKLNSHTSVRYWHGGMRATTTCNVLGVALDASRIGTRKRMQVMATVPPSTGFWLPTKAL